MIVNAWGVVLARRDWREADRLSTLYTETLGKVAVRFAGVNKPGRKLKALSEPMVWAEFRLYLSPRSEIGKAIGGRIISSFPSLRGDLDRTVDALTCCEMLSSLTPLRAPNGDKYALIAEALETLEKGPSPWLVTAYGLRLLELSGFGLLEAGDSRCPARLWEALHHAPLLELSGLSYDADLDGLLRQRLVHEVESHTGRELKSAAFAGKLHPREAAA